MNKKERQQKKEETYAKYCTPEGKNYKRDVNAVYFNISEGRRHFMKKCEICYDLRETGVDFITEACTMDGKERHDIVELQTDLKYEVETNKKRAERFKDRKDIIVIKLWEQI